MRTAGGAVESFPLRDGLSVAAFDEQLHGVLRTLGVDVEIRESPFGVPMTTPFPSDTEHASYDPEAVERFFRVLDWSDSVFEEFSGWYCGKTSPVHLFWHSFDLAVTRFGGPARRGCRRPTRSPRRPTPTRWSRSASGPATPNVREPTYYAYAAPEPAGLRERPLRPAAARWVDTGTGSLAQLPYEAVRTADDPRAALLGFLDSAYRAGAGALGWDVSDLDVLVLPLTSRQRRSSSARSIRSSRPAMSSSCAAWADPSWRCSLPISAATISEVTVGISAIENTIVTHATTRPATVWGTMSP